MWALFLETVVTTLAERLAGDLYDHAAEFLQAATVGVVLE